MKPYIPELSAQRMMNRAPDWLVNFGADSDYIFSCLRDVEQSFELVGFPGLAPRQIPARALIKQFIVWWRTLEPATPEQREAHGRLPAPSASSTPSPAGWRKALGTTGISPDISSVSNDSRPFAQSAVANNFGHDYCSINRQIPNSGRTSPYPRCLQRAGDSTSSGLRCERASGDEEGFTHRVI